MFLPPKVTLLAYLFSSKNQRKSISSSLVLISFDSYDGFRLFTHVFKQEHISMEDFDW